MDPGVFVVGQGPVIRPSIHGPPIYQNVPSISFQVYQNFDQDP